ncbi:MAG: 3-dehydroquinate synthase [Chitinophagaceae bacterium]|nr:3-dehydroquinate synthase [Chitinophagaceae bacterium]
MEKKKYTFSQKTTSYYFDTEFNYLDQLVDRAHTIIVTDENIFRLHKKKLTGWNTIVLKPGEQFKVQATVDDVVQQLIAYKADRKSHLIGIGGGVTTDITGYAASVYMRGIAFGFMPVSLLAMVDASIGGKNGIDVGVYKNFVGTIRQPDFLLYDISFLKTLPQAEWANGFAEIIKHACIKDARLFRELEQNNVAHYKKNNDAAGKLIRRNAVIKSNVVLADEFEQGERKLLNFGHTWGHAVETKLSIPHGHAVAIGMVMACKLSEKLTGFKQTQRVVDLLKQYGLPVHAGVNKKEVFEVLKMDKKKDKATMNYVLLNDIGKAIIKTIPFDELENLISNEN